MSSTRTPEPGQPTGGNVLDFPATRPMIEASAEPEPVSDEFGDVVDAEIVDESEPIPVDQPDSQDDGDDRLFTERLAELTKDRRPIVASWLRSWRELAGVLRWAAAYAGHTVAFHALRSPIYAVKLLARAPRGLVRAIAHTAAWATDAEGQALRELAVERRDHDAYLKLKAAQPRGRFNLVLIGCLILTAAALIVVDLAPVAVQLAAAALAIGVLGWIGTPADKPVLGRAVVSTRVPKLTSDAVVAALGGLGIANINQAIAGKGPEISFPSPIMKDGPGWRADVDLPLGVTAGDVMDRRARLASGLRRPIGCVWPEGDRSVHEGRLVLWVGDRDMSTAKPPRWPLAKGGRVDLFKPVPFGTDPRGRWVEVTFMYVSGAIGAIPRMGKTVTLREILIIASLDPRAELHVYDLKGTGDLSPFELVAHRYAVGDDPADIEYAVVAMRELRQEMRRRTKVIRELPDSICPDSRVEPVLADNPKLRLHPIVVGVDECQVWFEHPEYGKELEEICTDLVKRGPATGIMLFLATQRPDSKSIPTGISANVSFRYCLKVMGQTENDMVLGTSQYQAGIRATTFAWTDKGIGYLRGDGSDTRIVRSVYTDKPAAKKIIAKARAIREALGNITGYAAGHQLDTEAVRGSVLDDVAAVFHDGEDRLWSEVVLSRLTEMRPEYAAWNADTLAAALKPHHVAPRQVAMRDEDGVRRNRRGYRLDDITRARAKRHRDDGG